jgi:TetR/AcrR family transcriptional regulator, transcriptional repressor for nem operon
MQKANRRRRAPTSRPDTAQNILDAAERLVQTRGYNGFSYADIAAELGVTKASLHYHFASKADLGCALIERYQIAFTAALAGIDETVAQPRRKLAGYVELYDAVIRNDRMCLCGMLAAEHATLPPPMQLRLQRFFDANERWLSIVLEQGRRASEFAFRESPSERARVVLSALEGAMLVARSYDDPRRFRSAADFLLSDLCTMTAAPARAAATRARRARA